MANTNKAKSKLKFNHETIERSLRSHDKKVSVTYDEYDDGQIITIWYDNNHIKPAKCVTISEVIGEKPSIYYDGGFSSMPKYTKQKVKKLIGGYKEQYPF